jgi:hypothetical protein
MAAKASFLGSIVFYCLSQIARFRLNTYETAAPTEIPPAVELVGRARGARDSRESPRPTAPWPVPRVTMTMVI